MLEVFVAGLIVGAVGGYIAGFWTGVHYEKRQINDEIVELTTIIRKDAIEEMEAQK